METSLYEGDIVYIVPRDPEKIIVGDIIVFHVKNTFLVHRVADILVEDEQVAFITKGDAHLKTDQEYGLSPVSTEAVVGVLFSINKLTLSIPRVGLVYTIGHDFIQYWTSGKVFLFVPCLVLAAALIVSRPKKRDDLHKFPFSRSSITKKIVALMIVFTITIIQLSSIPVLNFRVNSFNLALGVDSFSFEEVDFNLGSLKVGQAKNVTVSLYALSAIKVAADAIVYLDGNITELLTLQNNFIRINPEDPNRINIFAYAPLSSEKGVYQGQLSVYSRPLFGVLPSLKTIWNVENFWNVLVIDFVTNLVIALGLIVFQFFYLLFSNRVADTIIWNYEDVEWIGNKMSLFLMRLKEKIINRSFIIKARQKWKKIKKAVHDVSSDTTKLPIRTIPIMFFLCLPSVMGHIFVGLLLSTIITSAYVVCVRKQAWKKDATILSIGSSLFASILYMFYSATMHNSINLFSSFFSFFTPIPYLSMICLLITMPCTYLIYYFSLIWAARLPERSLTILGDWNVVP
jgi:signal peptidase I